MTGDTAPVKGHRWFAALYDRVTGPGERRLLSRLRPRIMGETSGRVLEIGVGTGASLEYYPKDARVTGTEPDPFMLERAERKVAELGLTNVELRLAAAERLPFEDASFDHVVSSLVLCTVDNLDASLREAKRVLKPDGTFRFMEHVRNDESAFWGTVQDTIRPVWRWFAAGCNPNRRTRAAIEDVGFRIEWAEELRIGPGTPAIYGVARPA
jgi:ubiquinone/menaquinone biosynthesis C-methylase UbiE